MFDCPFNDRMPGRMKLVGWPWRGLTTMPVAFGAGSPSIALPNGQAKILDKVLLPSVGAGEFALPGDSILFEDPRAVPVARTTDEQVADAAAGYQWLPYVIYPTWARIIYGQRLSVNWIWHDGDMNYAVAISGQSLRLSPLVIGRTQASGRSIDLTQVGSYSQQIWPGSTALVVLDALPDGSKVMVGRYQRHQQTVNDDPALLAPCRIPLVEIWEYRLSRSGDEISAEYECIRTPTQIVGEVTESARPAFTTLPSVSYGVQWEQSGSVWIGEATEGGGAPSIGTWGAGFAGYSYGPYSYNEAGRIVSAYYGTDGLVKEITLAISSVSDFSYSRDSSVSGSEAVVDDVGPTGYGTVLVAGSYEMVATYSNQSSAVTSLTLKDGGVPVSTVTISTSGSVSLTYTSQLGITTSGETRSSATTSDHSGQMSVAIDGLQVYSDSTPNEYVADGLRFVRSVSSPSVRVAFDQFPSAPDFTIEPVRYSSQVHSLALRRQSPDQSWIGPACHRGGITPGMTVRAGPILHLYGTQNPATGQVIRDSSDPIVWI